MVIIIKCDSCGHLVDLTPDKGTSLVCCSSRNFSQGIKVIFAQVANIDDVVNGDEPEVEAETISIECPICSQCVQLEL